ncbi:MAG: hypothetical protein COS85_16115, partial [Armatimonadetes bacterium CG07_land_8_20_14_0_80_59_28]
MPAPFIFVQIPCDAGGCKTPAPPTLHQHRALGTDRAFTVGLVSDTLAFNGNNLYAILATARTKRYVRISLTDAANPSGYLQIGTIFIGKGAALNRGPSVPYQRGPLNETEVEKSPSANLFTVQERPSLDNKALSFIGLNNASEAIVEA